MSVRRPSVQGGVLVSRRTVLAGALGLAVAGAFDWNTRAAWAAVEPTVLTVSPDGTADFLSPKLANASITSSSETAPYVILVQPGVYTEREWTVAPYTTVRGTSRTECVLAGSLPDSATDAQIAGNSTLWLKKTSGLENLTITAMNMRYAVHSESSGANVDAVHLVKNCRIEHFGNQGARTWRTANPGSGMSPSTVWVSERPWGYGSASGVYERFEDCTFVGTREPWYIHTNKDFAAPTVNELVNCELIQTGAFTAPALTVQSLGSGQHDSLTLTGCDLTGRFIYGEDKPWITVDPLLQLADKAEIAITLTDCSPIGYRSAHRGIALKVTALSTGTDVLIEASGDAAPLLLGASTFRHGGGGVASYLYGQWDISGILVGPSNTVTVNNTLGRRLGDCATTPRQLVLTFGGTTSRTIDFTTDLIARSNSEVLNIINAQLTGVAIAAEYAVATGESYPTFTDRESITQNVGTAGITRWAAVVLDGAGVRLMSTTDPATALAGVAIEQIGPGRSGRILASGILRPNQLLGISTATVLSGQPLYLSDSVAGRFSMTGTRQVGAAVADGWLELT
ncbi:hypothetical protein LTA6_000142 [Microbacterium sp. LTA6]|uniref:hypothetical protein n=1 Tax=unclassified Microbacterium TaxID=2609290 RepID=UPI0031391882